MENCHIYTKEAELEADEDDDNEDDNDEQGKQKGPLEKVRTYLEIAEKIQNGLGKVAHYLEGVKNIFNFSVPFLSWLVIGILMLFSVIFYWIGLRHFLILWGIFRFSHRRLAPHHHRSHKSRNLLSRAPDDEQLEN